MWVWITSCAYEKNRSNSNPKEKTGWYPLHRPDPRLDFWHSLISHWMLLEHNLLYREITLANCLLNLCILNIKTNRSQTELVRHGNQLLKKIKVHKVLNDEFKNTTQLQHIGQYVFSPITVPSSSWRAMWKNTQVFLVQCLTFYFLF